MDPDRQCTAHNRHGVQCRRAANIGMTICNAHGGRAPQVRRRAQQRILEASDKAAYALVQMMGDEKVPAAVRLAAARDLLDRANLVGKQEVELSVKRPLWEQVAIDILVDIDEDENVIDAIVVDEHAPTREILADEETLRRHNERVRENRRAARRKRGA